MRLGLKKEGIPMRGANKITEVAISTKSTEPLAGIVEIGTADSTMKSVLNEDLGKL